MEFQFILGIQNADLRHRWVALCEEIRVFGHSRPSRQPVVFSSLDEATNTAKYTAMEKSAAVVLISDGFLPSNAVDGSKSRDLVDMLAAYPIVTIAISDKAKSIMDIDVVVASTSDTFRCRQALTRACSKSTYLLKSGRGSGEGTERPARELATIDEFREALKIRHNVYSIMGYLDDDYFKTQTKLEVNWCDAISRHYGIFVTTKSGNTELAAIGRVILSDGAPASSLNWRNDVVGDNQALIDYISRQRLALAQHKLPAFEALHMSSDEMLQAFETEVWGELSRVIVPAKWRGRGFSKQIVKCIIDEMKLLGVKTLILECLDIHAPIYEWFGFKPMGQRGESFRIGKTMVGMKMSLSNCALENFEVAGAGKRK